MNNPNLPDRKGEDRLFEPDREQETATVRLGLRLDPKADTEIEERLREIRTTFPHERRPYLTAEEAELLFTAPKKSSLAVESHLERQGLRLEKSPDGLHVSARGTLRDLERVFHTRYVGVEKAGVRFSSVSSPAVVPREIAEHVDNLEPVEEAPPTPRPPRPSLAGDDATPYKVSQITEIYRFPDNDGQGEVIGIVTLGGGYSEEDLSEFCRLEGIQMPEIVDYPCSARNQPAPAADVVEVLKLSGFSPRPVPSDLDQGSGSDAGMTSAEIEAAVWTIETTADIEIAAAAAPGAKIVVFFAKDADDWSQASIFLEALSPQLSPGLRPSVLSSSWGQYEFGVAGYPVRSLETSMRRAACQGVSVCFASGDYGGGPVYYPACDPYVLSCGGSGIVTAPGAEPLLEEVWREPLGTAPVYLASGGGVSQKVTAPEWQSDIDSVGKTGATKPGRAIPDVAGHSRVSNGYQLVIGNRLVSLGGTSCVTPLWAGLLARINVENRAELKAPDYRLGFITSLLYRPELRAGFAQVTTGSNGLYAASPEGSDEWNPCTGWGRPIGVELARKLRG